MGKTHGVKFYKVGIATVPVYFPEGQTVCRWCPYVRYDESLMRHRCIFSGEYLLYPMETRGVQCPLRFEDGDHEDFQTAE